MLQHDNARPHVARICTQFLEAENIPVLAWPAYSPDMSPTEHVWDALHRRIRPRVPGPANIQQLLFFIYFFTLTSFRTNNI
uniref:Tc1-like transposase DDE domain-containing protein n=1 Tax=Sander lucioperca TaxID=283035 RepID=A0A8C9Z3S1_SANLU